MTSTPTSSPTHYFLPSSSMSIMRMRPLLASLFLSWLTIIISIITLLLLLNHATHDLHAGYSWRLMKLVPPPPTSPPPPGGAASAATVVPTLVLRKALSVYKLDHLSRSNVRFHYVKHSHGHHHHHHHHGHVGGPVQKHSPAAVVNSYGSAAVAEGIVAPPDPLYRYPVVTTVPSPVDPHNGTYVYGDEKRLVPTGPNPLHH